MLFPLRILQSFALVGIASLGFAGETFSGRVVGISDGDTITVLREPQKVPEKVRLHQVDAPEHDQAFGQAAKQFTSAMVFGQNVTVQVADHDRYGRTVGDVFLANGANLNRELVRNGYAWWYRQYSKDPSIGELESKARIAHLGLWADNAPVPPWDFRKTKLNGPAVRIPELKYNDDASPVGIGGGRGSRTYYAKDGLPVPPPSEGGSVSAPNEMKPPTVPERRLSPYEIQTKLNAYALGTTQYIAETTTVISEKGRPVEDISIGINPAVVDVYVTPTGKKYHRANCRMISSSTAERISLADARARGLSPCSLCNP